MSLHVKIKKKWETLERNIRQPSEIKKVRAIEYREFLQLFKNSNIKKIEQLIEDFYSGDIFAIKNSFSKKFFEKIKLYLINNFDNKESIFYKTKEGCPNFHRIIGNKESLKYALKSNRHDYYFFPWNRDKEKWDLFDYFYPKWRLIKLLSGLKRDEFEKNTPKDGTIDRLLFRIYPKNTGHLEAHIDPPTLRVVSGIQMSKKGVDFDSGGLHFFQNNLPFDAETLLDVGDIVSFYHTLKHGVKKISSSGKNHKTKHRWWANMSNPISDEIKNRTVQKRVY